MKKKINQYFIGVSTLASVLTLLFTLVVCYQSDIKQTMQGLSLNTGLIFSVEGIEEPETLEKVVSSWRNLQNKSNGSASLGATLGVASALNDQDVRVTLIDIDGSVIYDSEVDVATMGNHADRPEVLQARLHGDGEETRFSTTLGTTTCYYARAFADGKVLRMSMSTGGIYETLFDMIPGLAAILLVIFVIGCLVSYYLTGRILAPIAKIAKQPMSTEVPNTYPELSPLLETIAMQKHEVLAATDMRQQFTANVSHELKTPLTAISGYSELIETGIASEADMARFGAEIHHNADRLLKLINDIIRLSELDMGAAENEKPELLDLGQVVESCIDTLQIQADKYDVNLRTNLQSVVFCGYRQQLEELIYNLCDNAIRYNVKGGQVLITVEKTEDVEHPSVLLSVKDTGIGIPEEEQNRVFERFYRVDKGRSRANGGTGLGLAIVKHIVVQAGGTIRLTSALGEGTTMSILLPISKESKK